MAGRVNLLNWDAKGGTEGLFPPKPGAERGAPDIAGTGDTAGETVTRPAGTWGRSRSNRLGPGVVSALAARDGAVARQVAGLAVSYPDSDLLARLPLMRMAVSTLRASVGSSLAGLLDHLARTPPEVLTTDYVATFDLSRRHAALDLLHPRRHPQARPGPAADQADLPPVRVRARRLRAPRPPRGRARVRRHRRRGCGYADAAGAPRRAGAARPGAGRRGLAVRGGDLGGVGNPALAARHRARGHRPPGGRGPARRGGRPRPVRSS